MKKFFALACVVTVLSFATGSYGKDTPGPYVGIGGSYAIENFDVDSINLDGSTFNPNFDDTWGLNAKVGYRFIDWLALEFNFDYLSEFEADHTVVVLGLPVKAKMEIEVMTFMIAAKFAATFEKVKPFLIVGGGYMRADADVKASVHGFSLSDSDSESDPCAELGLGIDFFPTDNVSLGFKGSHVWGFGDLDEIRYFNLTLGAAYHF